MPELPEVETSKRYLSFFLKNSNIVSIQLLTNKLRWKINTKIKHLFKNLDIVNLDRIGKFILVHASNNNTLIIHLGMSGHLRVEEDIFKYKKHDHFVLIFKTLNSKKMFLILNDQRKFGYVDFQKTSNLKNHFLIRNLGIDAMSLKLNYIFLKEKFFNKSIKVKSVLLDQKIVCGIGNIYASEILFISKIHPLKKVSELNSKDIKVLIKSIKIVLEDAI